jgi:tetratricopeptide (TPR) repeat protein
MFKQPDLEKVDLVLELSSQEYRPAQAANCLSEGRYYRAVEICQEHLREETQSVSGRLIYALALYGTGQTDSAAEQFYQVLCVDPDNLVALKYLGDIKFTEGDEVAAMANYSRILEIDPHCRGLKSDLKTTEIGSTRTITLSREAESSKEKEAGIPTRWKIHFYTETIGDLYLAQGHPRLAAEVFRTLNEKNQNPRLAEKLAQAVSRIREKEH